MQAAAGSCQVCLKDLGLGSLVCLLHLLGCMSGCDEEQRWCSTWCIAWCVSGMINAH